MNTLKGWLDKASREEIEKLALLADTTAGNLRQNAGGYRAYSMKAGLAGRIATASRVLHEENKELPILDKRDLCADCAHCELAPRG